VGEVLHAVVSWRTFLVALFAFGFAPGAVLRLLVLAFPKGDPRRDELLAEVYIVPRLEPPFWVAQQIEVALFEGLTDRIVWAATGCVIHRWHLLSGVNGRRPRARRVALEDVDLRDAAAATLGSLSPSAAITHQSTNRSARAALA
jgi:hypothetical protein